MHDLNKPIKPISDEQPCGEKQNNSSLYIEMMSAKKPKLNNSMFSNGDQEEQQETIDWKLIKKNAVKLLESSHDLEIATTMCIASLHTDGFTGLTTGLQLIRQILEEYWDCCYPELEMDEPANPAMSREGRLAELAVNGFIKDIRHHPIISHGMMGAFSLYDFQQAYRDEPPEDAPKVEHIEGTMTELGSEGIAAIRSVIDTGIEEVNNIVDIFREKAGATNYPDLSELTSTLKKVRKVLASNNHVEEAEMTEIEQADKDTSLKKTNNDLIQSAPKSTTGQINNRDDVIKAIDKICKYYHEHEPSSPIPQLLERTKRLVNKEFIEILEDLSPEGVNQVRNILGIVRDN